MMLYLNYLTAKGLTMKIKEFKNGAYTILTKENHGYYLVKLYSSVGELKDKMLCDTYKGALDYFKSFSLIAKNS